jgi:hypothetical protein
MKLSQILAVFMIVLFACEISSRKIRRLNKSHSKHHSKAPVEVAHPIGNFFLQAFIAFLGVDSDALGRCLSGLFGTSSEGSSETTLASTEENVVRAESTTLDNIIRYVKIAITVVCAVKDKLWELVTGLFNESRRYRRTRLFYKGKALYAKLCFTCWVKSAYHAVVGAVTRGVTWLGEQLVALKDFLKAGYDKLIGWGHKVVTFVSGLYNKIKAYYNRVKGLQTAVACTMVGLSLYSSISALITNIPLLGTPVAVLVIVKNLICSIGDIISLGQAIKAGWNESNKGKKWGYYGKALGLAGKIFIGSHSTSGSKKRHRRHRLH